MIQTRGVRAFCADNARRYAYAMAEHGHEYGDNSRLLASIGVLEPIRCQ
jgi:hypothetical protein